MNCLNLTISPMLAKKLDISELKSFDFSEYLVEIKWDGSRSLGFISNGIQKLQNRKHINITKRYPDLQIKLKEGIKECIVDGEIVVMRNGIPNFHDLQHREHLENEFKIKQAAKNYTACYVIFDIIYVDGKDVTSLPLIERKKILKDTVVESGNVWISDYIIGNGKAYFEACIAKGLEGVMAKKLNSPYVTGKRTKYWFKIKKEDTMDTIVVGITEGEGYRKELGALVLACYKEGGLVYVGKAGSGISMDDLELLTSMVKTIPLLEKSPLKEVPPKLRREKVKWIMPVIVVEAKFMELTESNKMRSPVFVKVRDDKFAEECVC